MHNAHNKKAGNKRHKKSGIEYWSSSKKAEESGSVLIWLVIGLLMLAVLAFIGYLVWGADIKELINRVFNALPSFM